MLVLVLGAGAQQAPDMDSVRIGVGETNNSMASRVLVLILAVVWAGLMIVLLVVRGY